jgi:hypothetical protein
VQVTLTLPPIMHDRIGIIPVHGGTAASLSYYVYDKLRYVFACKMLQLYFSVF